METSIQIDRADREAAIEALNQLIAVCEDAHKLYASASEDAQIQRLRDLFVWHSRQRAQFAGELQGLVRWLGGTPAHGGSPIGALWRGYLDVKAALAGNDEAVLSECERAEARVKKAYEAALRQPLVWDVQDPIRRQFEIVCAAHAHLARVREMGA